MTEQKSTISRRTVAKGIAWTAPVLAVAGTAPAFAVSPYTVWGEPITTGCKLPGSSCEKETGIKFGYTLALRLCTGADVPVTVTFGTASIAINGTPATFPIYGDTDPEGDPISSISLDANGCSDIYLYADSGNSAEGTLVGTIPFTYPGADGFTKYGSLTVNVPSTPPCDEKTCAPSI